MKAKRGDKAMHPTHDGLANTDDQAWKTISYAIGRAEVTAGDTIHVGKRFLGVERRTNPRKFGLSLTSLALVLALVLFLVTVALLPQPVIAQEEVELWHASYGSPAPHGSDYGNAVAVDSEGNVIVVGLYYNGPGTHCYCTIRYGPDGNLIWMRTYDRPGYLKDHAQDVAVDSQDNIIVTGCSGNPGWTNSDVLTIKYDPDGNIIWAVIYNSTPDTDFDVGYAVAVDNDDNIIVAGMRYVTTTGTIRDFLTIKYDSNGNIMAGWPVFWHANSHDEAYGVAVDSLNNIIVTGYSGDGSTINDYCTIKYAPDGSVVWGPVFYNGGGDDRARGVAVDSGDNIIVTGYSKNGTGWDYCTIKYNSTGNPLAGWPVVYDGPAHGSDAAYDVAVDSGDNMVVTGYSTNPAGDYDYHTIKYDTSGSEIWNATYDGIEGDRDDAHGVAVGSSIIVTGLSTIWHDYNSNGVKDAGEVNHDFYTIKYVAPPNITSFAPPSPVNDTVCTWRTFNVTVNQPVNVSWYLNGSLLPGTNVSVTEANYTLHAEVAGEHNVSAVATNPYGTDMQMWIWNVVSAGVFDTGPGTYPSISGTHNGTITPNQTITVSKLYTYPCSGTGGHSEHVRIWNDTWAGIEASWAGYLGDWHNITFSESFTLVANETYNYTIRTGSYPQIIHESPSNATGGTITCGKFIDANGRIYYDWIPAIRLE